MRNYNAATDLYLIKEAIKTADAFGLGYITSVKNALEMEDIKPPKDLEKIIFNLLF